MHSGPRWGEGRRWSGAAGAVGQGVPAFPTAGLSRRQLAVCLQRNHLVGLVIPVSILHECYPEAAPLQTGTGA